MKRQIFLFILIVISFRAACQEATLLFFGDIMGHGAQIESAERDEGRYYDYSENFKYIEPYFRSADVVVGNLEVTLAGKPYKGYPLFSSPDELATALKESGVNVLVTANNHSCDRGRAGLERTIKVLDQHHFVRTGTFLDSTDMAKHHPRIIHINGIKLALLNYTYGTNGIPVTQPNIVNLIDKETMKQDLKLTKSMHPDKIIMFLHWGNEYATSPSNDQTELAEFLFEHGADIIIGAHPHVIQPMHLTYQNDREQLVVYSLGNFISNQRWELTDGGAMVRITLAKHKGDTYIKDAQHLLTWVHTPIIDNRRRYYIYPASVWDRQGVPDHIAPGWEGMKQYLKSAREVMQLNTYIREATEEWPLK
ncbi:CapA family protein [Natronoflexus pectinivorans]|uniref:Poly-gamma-glutamate synthesis protein (Capsule biosynthesis protein) n=1 Tax=Natronoflexus pectinivorans TaxID=682526 RepID=A0A4R2GL55_9BACT|nr:CapA family protein [Natronoflexus pectinivorans]TCO09633.1 poly-gamma-glutamate synthesis protein (capsule biosynthesis protein) [Natronoflexus pectinivorans]